MAILLFFLLGSTSRAQTLIDIAREFQNAAKQEVYDKSKMTSSLVGLIEALSPFIQGDDLVDPGTGQPLVSIADLQQLEQRLTSLLKYNQRLALQIQELENLMAGRHAMAVTQDVTLGLTFVFVVGVRLGLIVGIEDRGEASFLVAGIHIQGQGDMRPGKDPSCGLFAALDLSFDRRTCKRPRFISLQKRDTNGGAFIVGTTSASGGRDDPIQSQAFGLAAGLGGAYARDTTYHRFVMPFFWLPIGSAWSLKKLRDQQVKIMEAVSQFQTAKAFELSQDLQSRIVRIQRRAMDRGHTIREVPAGVLEQSHPLFDFQSLLHFILEKQKTRSCDTLLSKKA